MSRPRRDLVREPCVRRALDAVGERRHALATLRSWQEHDVGAVRPADRVV